MWSNSLYRPRSRKSRLYHSNLSLAKSLTEYDFPTFGKSVSMDEINRLKTSFPMHRRKKERFKRETFKKKDEGERLPLILPEIQPDVDLDLDVEARDASATVKAMSISDVDEEQTAPQENERADSQASDDYFNFDDDAATAKAKLHKLGEFQMEHNWLLQEELHRKKLEFNEQSKKLRVYLPDENPMDTIENRIREIKSMMKPKAELGHFMDDIEPEQRERIMKVASMDAQSIRKMHKQNWKGYGDQFRHGVMILKLLIRACNGRKKYFKDDKPETALAVKRLKQKGHGDTKDISRSSLGFDMQLALSTEPTYRNIHDIKKIVWVLRATKAFKHLFPSDVEKDLAQCVAYERYDSNRVMALQGREPERFYYIMTGKVQKIQEYRLSSGLVTRSEGYIEKGTTTDPEELENAWPREHHLVTRGQVEVLIVHRDDFLRLRNRTLGPPIDFLRTLDLFLEFPCEVFKTNHDSIRLKYYAQDATIVEDTNRTPWLHIVKSGRVRVVRSQHVIDVETADRKFLSQSMEELGCGRPFSHASAMLGSLISQRKMKAASGSQLSLPELNQRQGTFEVVNPFSTSLGLDSSLGYTPVGRGTQFAESLQALCNIIKRQRPVPVPVTSVSAEHYDDKGDNPSRINSETKSAKRKAKFVKAPVVVESGVSNPSSGKDTRTDVTNDLGSNNSQEDPNDDQFRFKKQTRLPPIPQTPADSLRPTTVGEELHPHGTYLTREMTEFDPVYKRRNKKEAKLRSAYLQLDILNPGDIFGLDSISKKFHYQIRNSQGEGLEHLQPPTASEAKGVSLVSDGAEVIEISKRFFLEHAQNNTMLRVETMQREYMTNDEAKSMLYTKETWDQYKSVLMRRLIKKLGQH